MPKTNNNLQEVVLTQLRRERRAVTVFLMNGFQIRGYITGFDAFIVVVNTDGKHPISLYPPEEG